MRACPIVGSLATTSLVGIVALTGLAGCGGSSKPASDPSAETPSPSANDEVPKWEGAAPPEEPKPKGTSGAAVTEAPARRGDQYDQEATEVVLKRAARQVKANCGAAKDESGKATGPWGNGSVRIQLGHNGRSKGVTVPAPFEGKPPGNCIEKAFTNLTFPPWAGADTEIEWPIEVVAPGSDTKK